MKRLLFVFLASLFLAVSVTGCNTMRRAGEDIESTGEAIQRSAD